MTATSTHLSRNFRSLLWVIALFASFIEGLAQDFQSNTLGNSGGYEELSEEEASKQFQLEQTKHYAQLAAQVKPPIDDRNIPPNHFIAEALGYQPTDPLFEHMAKSNFNFEAARNAVAALPTRPVVKHIKGTDGTPFPDAAKRAALEAAFEEKNQKIFDGIRDQLEEQRAKSIEKAAAMMEESITPIHVPTCEQSYREKIRFSDIAPEVLPFDPPQKNAPLVSDVLFLRVPPPPDADEFFGTKVLLFQITEEKGDAVSATYSKYGLECLPYRARIFAGYTEVLYGKDALMNFDKNKKGTLHPLVEKRIDDFIK